MMGNGRVRGRKKGYYKLFFYSQNYNKQRTPYEPLKQFLCKPSCMYISSKGKVRVRIKRTPYKPLKQFLCKPSCMHISSKGMLRHTNPRSSHGNKKNLHFPCTSNSSTVKLTTEQVNYNIAEYLQQCRTWATWKKCSRQKQGCLG